MMPTFGQTIRAARLGFHWSAKHQAMIRMADKGDHFRIWICPADAIPTGQTKISKHYRVWWNTPEILDACPPLTKYANPSKLIQIMVNDDGDEVERSR